MKTKIIIKSALVLAVVGIISAGLVYKFVINKPHQDVSKARPAHMISAAELFNSFRSDRQVAETKFNGQVVLLNGKLDKLEEAEGMVTGVFVFDQGMFGDEGVRCTMLPGQSENIKNIPQETEIHIKGYLTGYNDTDVILEQCSVIR